MRLQDFVSTKLYYPMLFPLISTPANPVRWRIRGMVRETEALMRRPLAEIKRRQAERIHELLGYAARHCEFYCTRFAGVGLTRERDLTVENLERVPVLTKQDVQHNFDSLLATGVSRITWQQNSSGG